MLRNVLRNQQSKAMGAARHNYWTFSFPHSNSGTNNAFNSIPRKEVEINREMTEGQQAPLAHQSMREFPSWYKPYGLNYMGEGYAALLVLGFGIFGYSYINDICEQKGRNSRKIFPTTLKTNYEKNSQRAYARERIAAGDE